MTESPVQSLITLTRADGAKLLTWRGSAGSRDEAEAYARRALELAWAAAADARGAAREPMPAGLKAGWHKAKPPKVPQAYRGGTTWVVHPGLRALLPDWERRAYDLTAHQRAGDRIDPLCEAGWPWTESPQRARWSVCAKYDGDAKGDVRLEAYGHGQTGQAHHRHDLDAACAAGALALAARFFFEWGAFGSSFEVAGGHAHAPKGSATLAAAWSAGRRAQTEARTLAARLWLIQIGAGAEADAILDRARAGASR